MTVKRSHDRDAVAGQDGPGRESIVRAGAGHRRRQDSQRASHAIGCSCDARNAPGSPAPRLRLDAALVARGLVATRARARDLVLRGEVRVDGDRAARPAQLVGSASRIEIAAAAGRYVSRGALKLRAGLDAFRLDVTARVCLDVGAAHGGFTEVLLERGAARVYAVENGHGQLVPTLARDPRVLSLERTDARALDARLVPEPITAVVADVSFISLAKALRAPLALTAPGAILVALVKPQFEAGPGSVGKDGVVRDPAARERAVAGVQAWLQSLPGWRLLGRIESPVAGGSGNVEYLVGAVRDA